MGRVLHCVWGGGIRGRRGQWREGNGDDVEGQGLKPDLPLTIFPENDLSGGHAKAIEALIQKIRAGAN